MSQTNDEYIPHLYSDLVWTWPIISPPGDYVPDTEFFSKRIKEHSKTEPKTLLHLGCGGGHNDFTFKRYFEVTGVDISEGMLEMARRLNPENTYYYGDMRTVRLGERFDAVAVLDSVNAMTTEEDLRSAFVTAYEHLRPGGIMLTIVEQLGDQFQNNATMCSTHTSGDVEITFIQNYYDPDPADNSYEGTFVFLIRRGGKLEIHTDHQLAGVFPLETRKRLLVEVGFEVEQVEFKLDTFAERESYPLLVCTKPL